MPLLFGVAGVATLAPTLRNLPCRYPPACRLSLPAAAPCFAGVVAALPIVYQVLVVWAARAATASLATSRAFTVLAWFSFVLSVGYAVNWVRVRGRRNELCCRRTSALSLRPLTREAACTLLSSFAGRRRGRQGGDPRPGAWSTWSTCDW